MDDIEDDLFVAIYTLRVKGNSRVDQRGSEIDTGYAEEGKVPPSEAEEESR